MRLLVVLALVLCYSLTSNGKGLLLEEQLINDIAELLNQLEQDSDLEMDSPTVHVTNQLEEDAVSFLETNRSFVPELTEDQLFDESSGVSSCSDQPCLHGGNCTVLGDSYVCECAEGFDGTNCQNENLCYKKPCKNGGQCKAKTGRSFSCLCAEGFQGKLCDEDIDECSTSAEICEVNAACKNTQGSYTCACKDGYSGNANDCSDIDECSNSADICDVNAACENTQGSYTCTCKTGYSGDGNTCSDINDCSNSADICDVNAACKNAQGSYTCTCKAGYSGNGKSCSDIDECAVKNSGCSHDCTNTVGSYICSCPDAELSLADDKHSCEAKDVIINCLQNEMSITIPKPLLERMDRQHLRLLDPKCGATETPTHFILKTPLTGCNTTRRHTKSAIVYSNKVLEIPLENSDIITRVREIEITFSCYYSNSGMATAVGVKPESRKLVFSEKGYGNFTVVLELFHSKSFGTSYNPDNFPVSLKLRQHMFLQVKVHSNDKRLSVMVEKSFATPTPNENDPEKHVILDNGCAVDDTVEFYPSPTGYYRFSLEAFEFVDQPAFVFIHCHVIICNASDAQSRCARGCENKDRRRREVGHHSVYSLAQGPITLDYDNEHQEQDENRALKKIDTPTDAGVNVPLIAAIAAMTALTIFGVAFMSLRRRSRDAGYLMLDE